MDHTRADGLIAYFVNDDEGSQYPVFGIGRKRYDPIETQVEVAISFRPTGAPEDDPVLTSKRCLM
jgi:hypothetical protein